MRWHGGVGLVRGSYDAMLRRAQGPSQGALELGSDQDRHVAGVGRGGRQTNPFTGARRSSQSTSF
jgi:hypothetical protein